MELEIATLFIISIILILWEIKADFVLLIFGFAAYLFLLFYISTSDPFASIVLMVDFLIFNPLGLLLLLIPLGIFGVYKYCKNK
ncbi:hypothetical protein LCGC14_1697840 [marine sediment metagenome]|uniref:Uncharacterized protein n=1 Tax=marine sediment metagenome TaxID=412755 RepID=A0A0F9HJC5_9ZZZZ